MQRYDNLGGEQSKQPINFRDMKPLTSSIASNTLGNKNYNHPKVLPKFKNNKKNTQYICLFKKHTVPLQSKNQGYLGRVARQRSAKPCTAVRIRQVPHIRRRTRTSPVCFKTTLTSKES